eukprot:GDKJ01042470.1.p1 GENE.GDKJ01042470.1~~GDKJ01042470.1.p1  ORF type:complete len:479 (-),score=72.20 GDKJ01042470.1:176-1612(-)
MFSQYDELVKAIIRPKRAIYNMSELGPTTFTLGNGVQGKRTDFILSNPRGHDLQCSHFEPSDAMRRAEQIPCVIYLHGNSSCRLEAIQTIPHLLPMGVSILAFDFSGSGLSGGDYVSLGFYERQDVETAVEYLRSTGRTSFIGLWGRSMGAATALMYGEADPSIACMVVDSPFASLRMLAEELVESFTSLRLSKFIVSAALMFVRRTILNKANFDIDDLCPIRHASKCFIPAFFVHGEGDSFIHPHHSKQISQLYSGDHELKLVDGDHNSTRPSICMTTISCFFYNHFQMENLPMITEAPVQRDPTTLLAHAIALSGQAVSPKRSAQAVNSRRARHTNATLRAQAIVSGSEIDSIISGNENTRMPGFQHEEPCSDNETTGGGTLTSRSGRREERKDKASCASTIPPTTASTTRPVQSSRRTGPPRGINDMVMPASNVRFDRNGNLMFLLGSSRPSDSSEGVLEDGVNGESDLAVNQKS